MKITENVYFYQGLQEGARRSWSNSVVIKNKKCILIDSGSNTKNHLEDLQKAMAKDGIEISKIDELWYSHGHPDHAGSAGSLYKQLKCKVRCHYLAQEVLEGPLAMNKFLINLNKEAVRGKKIIRTPSSWRRFGLKLSVIFAPFAWLIFRTVAIILEIFLGKWLPVSGLEVFEEDGELVEMAPSIQILFLPGHTTEEVGFWIPSQKVLISGDLISTTFPWREKIPILNNPNSSFSQTLLSLKKIVDLPVEIFIPGHGFFLGGENLIKDRLTGIINSMESHRKKVKELVEKNPKMNTDKILAIALADMSIFVPYKDKKNYLEAILDDLGYYPKDEIKKRS